ncbi:MAG: hypothetical protein U1F67_25455 [Rubrivivax sp.]
MSAVTAQDIKRVPSSPGTLTAPEIKDIGRPHSLLVRAGKLYIGGTKGLAALDEKGTVLWTTELPEADGRAVDVDGEHVAYSSFLIAGLDRGSGLTAALMWGSPSQKLVVERAEVGVVASADGKPVWQVKLAEATGLSPPALGGKALAVQGAKNLLLYERATGKPITEILTFTNWLGLSDAWNSRLPVMRPLWVDGGVITAHQSWMKKVNEQGEELVATKSLGKNFTMLTTGPLLCKDKVILSEAAYPEGNIFSGKKARVYAASVKGEKVWYEETPDDVAGTSDLTCNEDTIFAVSNAMVTAFSYAGKEQWRYVSKGGVLIPGTHRGLLKAGTLPIAHQITAGRQAVVAGPYLYVTSRAERTWKGKSDVITVFDIAKGEIVEQIDPNTIIVDMAVFGSDLALTTTEGLRFIALKQ